MKNLIVRFFLLSIILAAAGCGKDKDLIGSWEKETKEDGCIYIETYTFEDEGKEKTFTFTYEPTDYSHIGFSIKGTWETDFSGKLKLSYKTSSLEPLYNFEANANSNVEIEKYIDSLKSRFKKKNEESIKFEFKADDLVFETEDGEVYYTRVDKKEKKGSRIEDDKEEIVEVVVADPDLPDYDWLQTRYADFTDIADLSKPQLRIMRNYIFARHGYIFQSPDLTEYFSQYPWYEPLFTNVTPSLNSIELKNIEYIKSFE